MNILTKDGYKDASECIVGEYVLAYDLFTGERFYNRITKIDLVDPFSFAKTETFEDITDEDGNVTPVVTSVVENDIKWYLINEKYLFFSEQSVWCNMQVTHVKLLKVGDIIYSENDEDIEITSISSNEIEGEIFYRFHIDGDSSFIANGITLHNASRYWNPAANANWNAAGNIWATTDGGSTYASTPGIGDTAYFSNANSYQCTVSASQSVDAIDFTVGTGFVGIFRNGGTTISITLYGSLTCSSSMTFTMAAGSYFYFNATTSGQTITMAGNTFYYAYFYGSGGEWILQDDLGCSGTLTLRVGTLLAQNYNITAGILTPYAAFTLTMGSGTFELTSNASANIVGNNIAFTFNAGTSTVLFSGSASSTNGVIIFHSSISLYNFTLSGVRSSTGSWRFTQGVTVTNLFTIVAPNIIKIYGSQTIDLGSTGNLNWVGTSGNEITLTVYSGTSPWNVTKTSGTVVCDYLSMSYSAASGGATFYAGANSTDVAGCSGWIFTGPPAGGAKYLISLNEPYRRVVFNEGDGKIYAIDG